MRFVCPENMKHLPCMISEQYHKQKFQGGHNLKVKMTVLC